MTRSPVILLVLAALPLLALGCGSDGPPTATVSGEVKLNGTPVAKGLITFSDGGTTSTADIVNGRYQAKTTAGKKSVMVSAPVVIGKRKESTAPDAATVEITEESVPAKYNSTTELTFDAQAGANKKDWELTAPKRK